MWSSTDCFFFCHYLLNHTVLKNYLPSICILSCAISYWMWFKADRKMCLGNMQVSCHFNVQDVRKVWYLLQVMKPISRRHPRTTITTEMVTIFSNLPVFHALSAKKSLINQSHQPPGKGLLHCSAWTWHVWAEALPSCQDNRDGWEGAGRGESRM